MVEARQVAFVSGTNAYDNFPPTQQLQKAINDANSISATLRRIGFEVFTTQDVDRRRFLRTWQQFLDAIKPGDTAVFYFAGHGFEINGTNFLLPKDVVQITDGEAALRGSALRVGELLDQVNERQPQVAIFILDACRNNPFAGGTRAIGSKAGLRREEPPSGTLVMMSAGTGQEALDSLSATDEDPNSVYTRSLIPLLLEPGLEITDVAKRVRNDVEKIAATVAHKQRPAFYHELSGDFYLLSNVAGSPAAASPRDEAATVWQSIKLSTDPTILAAYARKFEGSVYAAQARARIDELKRSTASAPASAGSPARPEPSEADADEVWAAIKDTRDHTILETFIEQYANTSLAALARARLRSLTAETSAPQAGGTHATPVSGGAPVQVTSLAPGPGRLNPSSPGSRPQSFRDCEGCPEMISVPEGAFVMGSPPDEAGRAGVESPQRKVSLARPFAAGRFAVSRGEWKACLAGGGCGGHDPADAWGSGDRFPVVNVSYRDAQAYVEWLSRMSGKRYRLLSEAEREYAGRAGSATPFWWGTGISVRQANFDGTSLAASGGGEGARRRTMPIDFFSPNPWGLYQVHGNVAEWVEDCFHPTYAGSPTNGSAWGSATCGQGVTRGGSWLDGPQRLRSASRAAADPGRRAGTIGFRVARDF